MSGKDLIKEKKLTRKLAVWLVHAAVVSLDCVAQGHSSMNQYATCVSLNGMAV